MQPDSTAADLLARGETKKGVERAMHEFGPAVRGLLFTIFTKDRDAAEEAFSLFAENLLRHGSTYRGEAPLRGWVYAIARNAAISVKRDGWRRLGRRLETSEAERLADDVRTRTAEVLQRQSSVLDALRSELDLDDQLLLTLRLDEQLSWEEVAQVMSSDGEPVDPQGLRKRFQRLKERIGDEARRRGLLR